MADNRWSALEREIAQNHGNIVGLVVLQGGERLYEGYCGGFGQDDCAHVFSVTKSVVSVLTGIAMERGLIGGLDDRVLDFFPDFEPARGEKLAQAVTLRDLLTMTAPFKRRLMSFSEYFTSPDWVKSSLDMLGGRTPGGAFRYMPIIGPDIFSGILSAATGQTMLDFAREALFEPLGFSEKRSIVFAGKDEQLDWYSRGRYDGDWVSDPSGHNTAGWGLTLTPREMAAFGRLCLDGGDCGGRRLVPEAWLRESTSPHSRWDEIALYYGYLWWVLDEKRFAAIGDGGNVIYIDREKSAVVSIAASFNPRAADRIELIQRYIDPLL